MAQVKQKPLIGEGVEERKKLLKEAMECFMNLFGGRDFDMDILKKFYTFECEEILKERKRIGGDWAVATVALSCEIRDHIR